MFDIAESHKTDLANFAGKQNLGDEVKYLQLSYVVENTKEQDIDWNGLTSIVTDQKEQIDALLNDFILDDADTQTSFLGKVEKEYHGGFILDKPDINNVRLIFGEVMDSESYETIEDSVETNFSFK